MIVYEVTATVEEALAEAFERYMVDRHVPDPLATRCFTGASVMRAEGNRFRMSYHAPDEAALRRYLDEHAPRLRADALAHFPSGVTLAREEWKQLKAWPH